MKLCANMMIYNELPFLEYVLERLLTFCDHVVAMDNGSTDGSQAWLIKARPGVTAIFSQQTNPPHYSNLRNCMLEAVPDGAWILKWDPDELPSDRMVSSLRSLLEADGDRHNGWKIPVYHIFKSSVTCLPIDFGNYHLRLFRKTPETIWQGAIHEQPTVTKPCGRTGETIAIVHFSYFAEARLRRKALHYASIGSSGFSGDPSCLTDRLDLDPVPLPEQITYQASEAWLETIRTLE